MTHMLLQCLITSVVPVNKMLSQNWNILQLITFMSIQFQIPATVPGGIYTDLQNAGILTSDLYYRFNEDNFKWVALTNWTYMTTFNLSKNHDIFSKGSIYLNCEGNHCSIIF